MRITLALLFSVILQISAMDGYAQRTKTPVTLSNVSMEHALNTIEENSDYVFLYNDNTIQKNRIVSVNSRSGDITDILNGMFRGTNVTFTIVDKQIILSTNKTELQQQSSPVKVNGVVKDAQNEPLIGVNVKVSGTDSGTVTDINGLFSISVQKGDVLEFSYIGHLNKTVKIINEQELSIQLLEDATVLSEVVVTALGIKKEAKSLSYNVQQISADEITKVPDANFINSLNGKIAGATINSASTGVGGSSRVVMRGTKSVFGTNTALYVIDGVPMFNVEREDVNDRFTGAGQTGDALAMINPDDIESISVLSGASAAALYGSAAANGVVMVTTKKGHEGKTIANFSNSTTFINPLVLPEFQNTYGTTSVGDFYSWGDKLTIPSTYAPKDFFQTGYTVTNSLNVSTGTEKNQSYVSLGNMTAEGIIRNNDFDRINFSFRNTSKLLNDKLTLDLQYNLSHIKEQNMVAQGEYHNPLMSLYLFPAGDDFEKVKSFERYDPSRNFPTQFWPYDDGIGLQNPYWITDRQRFENKKDRHVTTASLKYEINKGINLSGRLKLDQSNVQFERKFKASTNNLFASETGFYSLNEEKSRQIYGEMILNIDKYFWRDRLSLVANIGASIDDIRFDQNLYGGDLAGVPNLFTFSNVAQLTAESSQSGYIKQKQAVFASAQFGYKGMAYLDVTARNDWSSTLANTNSLSFFYPSVGLSGILTEIFKIDSSVLSYMKLRISYSEVGNELAYHISMPTYPVANGVPSTQTRMHNPYLVPERTNAWEMGANFGFFNNKLRIDATLYKSKTFEQIFDVPLPPSSGYISMYLNAGQIDNKGIELSANFRDKWGKFSWSTYMTYSLNRNKIVTLLKEGTKNPVTGEDIILPSYDMAGTGNYKISLVEGGTMSDIYVTSLRTDEHGAIYVDPVSMNVIAKPNDFIYAGSAAPKYNLSWGNTFGFNGLSLGFLVTARVGGIGVSNTQAFLDYYGVSKTTSDARDHGGALVNGYRIPAKEYYQTIAARNGGASSMYVYSATNVRLGELTLGYDIPVRKWTNVIKAMNVSFIGRNLFFFYNKAPYDPEATASTGTYFQGIDYFMQPSLRNLGFSVKLQF